MPSNKNYAVGYFNVQARFKMVSGEPGHSLDASSGRHGGLAVCSCQSLATAAPEASGSSRH